MFRDTLTQKIARSLTGKLLALPRPCVCSLDGVTLLLRTLFLALPALADACIMLIIVLYVYAVIGVAVFGDVAIHDSVTDQVRVQARSARGAREEI